MTAMLSRSLLLLCRPHDFTPLLRRTSSVSSTAHQISPDADEEPMRSLRPLLSTKSHLVYQPQEAVVTSKEALISRLAPQIDSDFKPNWDSGQRLASGLPVIACRIFLSLYTDFILIPKHPSRNNTHVAIKILTGAVTQLNHERKLRELEVFQRLSLATAEAFSDRCPRLLDHFIHPGIEEGDGDHICLVTELFWSNIHWLKEGFYPPPTVKRMLKHVLQGLAQLHSCGIAHTDVKPDNIMIDLGARWTTNAIDKWVSENPPSTYPPERSLHKMVSVFRSQPLPPPTVDEISASNFKLADFSNVQFVNDKTMHVVTPLGLRPPEVILGGKWDESVDIWTLGCIAFTLLTNRPLFFPMTEPEINASETDVVLNQMRLFCEDSFRPELLGRCRHSVEYFNMDCTLKKFQDPKFQFPRKPFDRCILHTGCILTPEDLAGATDFLGKCVRIEPRDRPTAQQLLDHPWLQL